jgi:hypothetical protein
LRKKTRQHTWQTNHTIPLLDCCDALFCLGFAAEVPRDRVLLGDLGEFGVEFRGLGVIVLDGLIPVRAETVLVQGVDVNGVADRMFRSETLSSISNVSAPWTVCEIMDNSLVWISRVVGEKTSRMSRFGAVQF